uniref:(northern house mosquito) hypothetical protein n=1 Tax=Culex pipiens TaxID=7175 RepID=A0A8D8AX57_CULPI
MSSANTLVEVLEEYHYLAEPFDRGQLKEMANAVPPKDCRADEEFRESLTSRQREVLDEVPELVRDRIGRRARQESVKDVVGMQVDVSAQYRVTCDSYKEMLGKIKIYELDVMLEDRHIEELRLDSLEVKYTMTDTLSKVALLQESELPEVNTS